MMNGLADGVDEVHVVDGCECEDEQVKVRNGERRI